MYKFSFIILIQYLYTFVACHKVIPIARTILNYGYCPYWDVKSQSLRLVDYLGESLLLYRYDYAQNHLYSATLEGVISPTFAIPMAGSKHELAVSNDKRIVIAHWDGISSRATVIRNMTAVEQDPIYASNHLDSARVDPKGRLVTGTFRTAGCVQTADVNGTLYLFRKNGKIVPLIHNLGTVAGLAWNRRMKLFYFFDLCTYTIYEYKWSPKTGRIKDGRPVFTFPATQTYAILGMDIDCRGRLYVGLYMASQIVVINPKTGLIEDIIDIPAETVNGVVFGGPKMDVLFVTTSKLIYFNYFDATLPIGNPSNDTMAGQIFMVKGLNTKGCPSKRVKSPL